MATSRSPAASARGWPTSRPRSSDAVPRRRRNPPARPLSKPAMHPDFAQRLKAGSAGFLLSAWLLLPGASYAQSVQDQLPEMGTAAQATLSLEDEARIGRMVMRGLRDSGRLLE